MILNSGVNWEEATIPVGTADESQSGTEVVEAVGPGSQERKGLQWWCIQGPLQLRDSM